MLTNYTYLEPEAVIDQKNGIFEPLKNFVNWLIVISAQGYAVEKALIHGLELEIRFLQALPLTIKVLFLHSKHLRGFN